MPIAISDLAPFHIRNVIFEALRHGHAFRADIVDHLVDLIDWSHTHRADRETVAMLRILCDASQRYELGELSLDGYRDLSVSLFFPVRTKHSPRRTANDKER
jgi:hypothetical protein